MCLSDLGAGKRPASAARHNAGPRPAGHVALGCGVPCSGLPTRLRGPSALCAPLWVLAAPGASSPAAPRHLRGPSVGLWGEGHLLCLQGLPGGPQPLAAHRSVHRADRSLCFAHPGQCGLGPDGVSNPQPGRMRRRGSPASSEDAQSTQGSAAAARTSAAS